jgi:hypothetical protein
MRFRLLLLVVCVVSVIKIDFTVVISSNVELN